MTRRRHNLVGIALAVMFAVLLIGCPADRYSTDPAASRIQHLTDFCIAYGAARDAATGFIKVDIARAEPVLTADMVLAFGEARSFIRPFCSPDFDPMVTSFDLAALNEALLNVRLILLAKENAP